MAEGLYPAANSDHSSCSSKTKLFHIEFSDLHLSKEDSIKSRRNQLECQLFEAESRASSSRAIASTALIALARKWCAVVCPDPCWHPVLPHGCFADRSDLAEVHTRDDLATNQITAMRVGDGERIATLAVKRILLPGRHLEQG